jgi:hypothetical protein
VAPCGSPHFPEWPVESLATQHLLTLNVLVLSSRAHCLWRLVTTLESEWAVVTKMLLTLISGLASFAPIFTKYVYVSAGNGERTEVV